MSNKDVEVDDIQHTRGQIIGLFLGQQHYSGSFAIALSPFMHSKTKTIKRSQTFFMSNLIVRIGKGCKTYILGVMIHSSRIRITKQILSIQPDTSAAVQPTVRSATTWEMVQIGPKPNQAEAQQFLDATESESVPQKQRKDQLPTSENSLSFRKNWLFF